MSALKPSAVRPLLLVVDDEPAIQKIVIFDELRQVNDNRIAAAKVLGISRRALYRRLDRHRLLDKAPRPSPARRSS